MFTFSTKGALASQAQTWTTSLCRKSDRESTPPHPAKNHFEPCTNARRVICMQRRACVRGGWGPPVGERSAHAHHTAAHTNVVLSHSSAQTNDPQSWSLNSAHTAQVQRSLRANPLLWTGGPPPGIGLRLSPPSCLRRGVSVRRDIQQSGLPRHHPRPPHILSAGTQEDPLPRSPDHSQAARRLQCTGPPPRPTRHLPTPCQH